MSLDTYVNLKSSIVSYFKNRSDIAAFADDFIDLSEAHFNNVLRCREMEATTTLTPVSNVCTLPTDYVEYKRVVELNSIRRPLEYITEAAVDEIYADRTAGLPCNFTIVGSSLTAYPLSSNDIELTYYQSIPALSDSNTTNWLLTKMPNLYLHSCLMYAAELTKQPDEMVKEGVLVERYIGMLQAADNRAKFGNAGITLTGVYP